MKKKLVPFALLFTYLLPLVGCGSKTCTITFDPNNGEETFSITVNKGELLPEPESPEKTAYDFKAWRFNNIKWSFKYEKVQSDMTLVAYYTPIAYKIKYDFNGGWEDNKYDWIDEYNIESIDALPIPVKASQNFKGWKDQDGHDFSSFKGNYGNKTLTAQWEFDSQNFLYFGSFPSKFVNDKSLTESIKKAAGVGDAEGDFVYEGVKYYQTTTSSERGAVWSDGSYAPWGTNVLFTYEPILWIKLKEIDSTKTMYVSAYTIPYRSYGESDMSSFAQSYYRTYLNNTFINMAFNENEQCKLSPYSFTENSTTYSDKVSLLSKEEYLEFLPLLSTLPFSTWVFFDSDISVTDYSMIISNKNIVQIAGHERYSWNRGYHTRTMYNSTFLTKVLSNSEFSYYGGSADMRPIIIIDNSK